MIRSSTIVFATLALSATAFAQHKGATARRMSALWQRSVHAKAAGDIAGYQRYIAQYDALRVRTGNERPERLTHGSATPTPSGVLNAVAPASCGNSPGVSSTATGTTGPINDVSVQTFTATIGGLGIDVYDVDLSTAITHTYNSDLELTLISPAGTRCDVSSNNAGANADVFNGTLWDDQSVNNCTSYPYSNGTPAPDLKPEQSLNQTFRGETPNGVWSLEVADVAGGDVGFVNSWSLTVTDGVVVPVTPGSPVTYTDSPNMFIADVATSTDSMTVSGAGATLFDVDLYTEITHTWNADLFITLQSPAGTQVVISANAGGAADDVFNGTWWDDSSTNPVAGYGFTNGVAAPDLQPDGVLAGLNGEDPNGVWQLIIEDQAGADVGNLARWDLRLTSALCGCSSVVTTYCTSATTTNGCIPAMGASALNASIAGGAGSFVLSASNVEGQQSGVMFYGVNGRQIVSWGAGSTSFLCVKAPLVRGLVANSGGTFGACNGAFTFDVFGFLAANPGADGNPLTVGQTFAAQAWFRDPPAAKTTNLSNAIEWSMCP